MLPIPRTCVCVCGLASIPAALAACLCLRRCTESEAVWAVSWQQPECSVIEKVSFIRCWEKRHKERQNTCNYLCFGTRHACLIGLESIICCDFLFTFPFVVIDSPCGFHSPSKQTNSHKLWNNNGALVLKCWFFHIDSGWIFHTALCLVAVLKPDVGQSCRVLWVLKLKQSWKILKEEEKKPLSLWGELHNSQICCLLHVDCSNFRQSGIWTQEMISCISDGHRLQIF